MSVGWLDKANDYSRGDVPAGFVERFFDLCNRPFVSRRGFYVCEFCDFEPDAAFKLHTAAGGLSSTVIQVMGSKGCIYYSPGIIYHYVTKHGYQPLLEFVRAVMESDLISLRNSRREQFIFAGLGILAPAMLSTFSSGSGAIKENTARQRLADDSQAFGGALLSKPIHSHSPANPVLVATSSHARTAPGTGAPLFSNLPTPNQTTSVAHACQ